MLAIGRLQQAGNDLVDLLHLEIAFHIMLLHSDMPVLYADMQCLPLQSVFLIHDRVLDYLLDCRLHTMSRPFSSTEQRAVSSFGSVFTS